MLLLILFAFLGGIVTILSPCILPILPIVLSGSIPGGKKRPLGIVTGFILSFTFFTLFLTAILKATGLPPDLLRNISIVIIAIFGLGLLIPKFQLLLEKLFSKIISVIQIDSRLRGNDVRNDGFTSGIIVGLSLGLLWTPCVGPILAGIIALAATQSITLNAVFITLAYAAGTSIPLLAVIQGGRALVQKIPHPDQIQKIFGILMIITALAIYMNWDRSFQSYILEKFPKYGTGLTKIEDNNLVKSQLQKINNQSEAPEFIAGGQWFNLPAGRQALTIQSLRGNVVLVDFWTYTCINCIRTLPYVKSWWSKYKDKGLVIVGVHTPEFAFEKEPSNVQKALKDFGITYPVMQDNDYATWQAYDNHYWPADYLIDKNGKIRDTHFGEGDYDQTEKKIQELLAIDMPIDNPQYQVYAQTPETYLGSAREGSGYTLLGDWKKTDEYAIPNKGATLTFPFTAAKVYLVMKPKNETFNANVRVYLDGKQTDTVTIDSDKLYTLINLENPGSHILKLEFLDDNAELYAFTFG
jgi:cytochrome c biogenesis protein CcdA/thiol-disulfide isomerase/thioredoxin